MQNFKEKNMQYSTGVLRIKDFKVDVEDAPIFPKIQMATDTLFHILLRKVRQSEETLGLFRTIFQHLFCGVASLGAGPPILLFLRYGAP